MKVSIVIPNFNGKHFLNDCFKSLLKQKNQIEEIILVDNGSRDGSQDFIKKYMEKYSFFKIIENEKNLGFSVAVNQGIEASKSDFVFLLNNDVEVDEYSIVNLLKCINSRPKIFSVASKMIQFNNRNLIDDAGDMYTILGHTKRLGFNKESTKYNSSKEIFSSCGGAALYRKSVFKEIGYFDESFFAYMEDVDIGYRGKIAGYKNLYCPKSKVYHVGSGSSGSQYNSFKIKLSAKNNVLVFYKNMPLPQLIINSPFLLLGFFIKFLFFSFKGYGKLYLSGLKKGINNLKKTNKTKYKHENLKNYLNIQIQLIMNTFKS
jgi:GT2 family glycosyltransferase